MHPAITTANMTQARLNLADATHHRRECSVKFFKPPKLGFMCVMDRRGYAYAWQNGSFDVLESVADDEVGEA